MYFTLLVVVILTAIALVAVALGIARVDAVQGGVLPVRDPVPDVRRGDRLSLFVGGGRPGSGDLRAGEHPLLFGRTGFGPCIRMAERSFGMEIRKPEIKAMKYEDFNGDGVIDNNDIQPITRSNTPEIYFGLDLSASWKGFDFSLLMQGATNYNVYMSGCLGNAMFNGSNTLECFMDRWHREDLYDPESAWIPGKYPSTWNSGKPSNTRVSTFNHISSYYLRVKNIEFGYTFPKEWLSKVYVERLRLYVSGNNVLTFDNLPFGDPEAPSSDRILYPQLKIWNIGVNVTF